MIKYNKIKIQQFRKEVLCPKLKKKNNLICKSSNSNADYSNSNNSENEYVNSYYLNSEYLDSEEEDSEYSNSDSEELDDYQNEQQDKIDESFEKIVKENQALINKDVKESKKKKRINYKHYANLDPTYEYTELDMYVNMVRYRLFLNTIETFKNIVEEELTFDNVREQALNIALKRTVYYRKYYIKERIIKNKLYKKFRTYRLIITQIFVHIANVYCNYIYWYLIIHYRCLKIFLNFLKKNAFLIFIDYPKALAIQYLTIKDKILLYSILYFEFVTAFTFAIKAENKKIKVSSDDYEMNSLMIRRRNLLTKRHRDSLPFVMKLNKKQIPLKDSQLKKQKSVDTENFSYIYKKIKYLFRKKFKSRRNRLYQRRQYKRKFLATSYPLYKHYIKNIANSRGIQKNIINHSFRSWNLKKNNQKQLTGYQFPELNLVNSKQEAINVPNLYVSVAKKSGTLPYSLNDFDRDIESYMIETKPDDLSYDWGKFRQSQIVADPVTSTKDVLTLATLKDFSKTWHGHRDYDLYLEYLDEIGFHWFIVSQADYNRSLAYERRKKKIPRNFFHFDDNNKNVPLNHISRNFEQYFPVPHMMGFFELPALHRLDRRDPESWRKLYLMNINKIQTALYEGPLLSFDKNRDIFFGGFIQYKFQLPSLFSVFNTSITPDRLRRKSVDNLRGSKRYKGRVRNTKLYSNYERGSFRKRLWANLFTGEKYNRLLLNEYKSAKHLKEDASTLLVRRINKGERMTAGNMSYLAFPEYYNVKSRIASASNIERSLNRAYSSKLMTFEEKREFEGAKKLESELFTDQLVKVIRDFNGNIIDQDTINTHIGKGGSIRIKFDSFGSDEFSNGIFVELLPLNEEFKYEPRGGFHNFVDLNKKGKLLQIRFLRFKIFNNILSFFDLFFNIILSTIFTIGSIDLFGLIPEYLTLAKITSTEDVFVNSNITFLLCILLLLNNTIILYFFYKIQAIFIRALAIHTLDYLYSLEEEYANLPIFSTVKHYIADWYNLSYFLPYTIYRKFDIDFGSVAGIDRYVGKLHELFEVIGYKPTLYKAPGFLLRPIKEERQFLRDCKNFKEVRQTHLILSGAPGTGKTYLVKALGGELGIPVLLFTPHQFIGGLEDKVQRLFEKAERMTPCIIFIDEIDSIGYARPNIDLGQDKISTIYKPDTYKSFTNFLRDRKGFSTVDIYKYGNPFTGYIGNKIQWRDCLNQIGLDPTEDLFINVEKYVDQDDEIFNLYLKNHEYDRSMLYRLLIECDGLTGRLSNKSEKRPTWNVFNLIRKRYGIGVIGATNRYHILDPALVRVGRFHTRLHFETLDENERYSLFQMKLGLNLSYDNTINWSYFVKMTAGWTPAELTAVVGHSNMIAYEKSIFKISHQMLNDSMNYILGINFLSDRKYASKEKGDLFLFKQTSRLFFDHAFQTGSNRDVYSKYMRLDDVDLISFRKKIASYFTIHDRNKKFFEDQLIGLLGPKIGEIFYHLYNKPKDFDSSENPIIITFTSDITMEYVAIFVSLMIDYWCLYSDDSLINGEALLSLEQYKRFSFERDESAIDALAIKIMTARMDHPEYHYLHDLFHFLYIQTPDSLNFLKMKMDWYLTYSIQFGLGKYTEGVNPYLTNPIQIFGHNVSFKFTSSIFLDFLGFQGDVIEQYIYKIINEALIRGCEMLSNNFEAFEFTKEKLMNSEYLRILDINNYFKQTTIKINYNYETN
uniref:cell division protein FtsH n=1 Tax=Prototheca vistulensis TaxID=2689584 RepID=UPI0030017E46